MNKSKNKKVWGGRFSQSMAEALVDFNASIDFDQRLAQEDIQGSLAHCEMLASIGLLEKNEAQSISEALKKISEEIKAGQFIFKKEDEDIHMNIERRLIELTGDIGKKIHTGRSRNDQVATDTRLFVRAAIKETIASCKTMQASLVKQAEKELDAFLPGYTHLQRAQPVSLAHHLLAYFEMLARDIERLQDQLKRVNILPLGSGAIAGTTLPLDRDHVRKTLAFDALSANSMDAVSDRDYIIEYLSSIALIMMHLSRLCEEWILWSSQEFNFCSIDDSLCTGSSMMPQKKNPDLPELVRGKCARAYGNLMTLLSLTKNLPLTYNKDLQEDKEPLFDSFDTVIASLHIMAKVVEGTTFNSERMLSAVNEPFILATDLAEYLVKKGVPFRSAHEIVGKTVRFGIENNKSLANFSLEEFQFISKEYDEKVLAHLKIEKAIDDRALPGGTSRSSIKKALKTAKEKLDKDL